MPAVLQLHHVPDRLVPHEPRIGGTSVPVPTARFAALAQSGSAVIGLEPGYRHAAGFIASVLQELRAVVRLPAGHACTVVPVPVSTVAHLVAAEARATVSVLTRRGSDWQTNLRAAPPETWRVADLTRTTTPISSDVLSHLDVAYFCASWVFALPAGLTVVALSPRATAAARPDGLGALFTHNAPAPTTTDLVMLGQAVRATAEAEPGSLELAANTRLALVTDWAANHTWITERPERTGDDVVVLVRTSLPVEVVQEIGEFLASHHLAYGVTDEELPGVLQIGLGETVPVEDLERLLGLLGFLVDTALR